jgi:hypothetical protein
MGRRTVLSSLGTGCVERATAYPPANKAPPSTAVSQTGTPRPGLEAATGVGAAAGAAAERGAAAYVNASSSSASMNVFALSKRSAGSFSMAFATAAAT